MSPQQEYSALGIKVEALETDVREVKDSILGLDTKIEKSITGLAHEMRASMSSLSGQFADRQRTPWAVIIPGVGLIVTVLVLFGGQALHPLQTDLKTLEGQIVPREEINFRSEVANRRMLQIESMIAKAQDRTYDEMREELRDLRAKAAAHRP